MALSVINPKLSAISFNCFGFFIFLKLLRASNIPPKNDLPWNLISEPYKPISAAADIVAPPSFAIEAMDLAIAEYLATAKFSTV